MLTGCVASVLMLFSISDSAFAQSSVNESFHRINSSEKKVSVVSPVSFLQENLNELLKYVVHRKPTTVDGIYYALNRYFKIREDQTLVLYFNNVLTMTHQVSVAQFKTDASRLVSDFNHSQDLFELKIRFVDEPSLKVNEAFPIEFFERTEFDRLSQWPKTVPQNRIVFAAQAPLGFADFDFCDYDQVVQYLEKTKNYLIECFSDAKRTAVEGVYYSDKCGFFRIPAFGRNFAFSNRTNPLDTNSCIDANYWKYLKYSLNYYNTLLGNWDGLIQNKEILSELKRKETEHLKRYQALDVTNAAPVNLFPFEKVSDEELVALGLVQPQRQEQPQRPKQFEIDVLPARTANEIVRETDVEILKVPNENIEWRASVVETSPYGRLFKMKDIYHEVSMASRGYVNLTEILDEEFKHVAYVKKIKEGDRFLYVEYEFVNSASGLPKAVPKK